MHRILFAYPEVSPIFPNGGIGTFVFEVTTLLASSGNWEVDILTDTTYAPYITQGDFHKAEKIFKDAGVRLLDLARENEVIHGWKSPDVTRAERYHSNIARLHAEKHYDIIEFPDWGAPGFFVVRHKRNTKSFSNTLLVLNLHSSTKDVLDWQGLYFLNKNDLYCHFMEEYVKKYSDIVLSPTEFLLRPVRQTQLVFEKLLFRNGLPISSSCQTHQKDISGDRRSGLITVACVSRLEPRKGQDILANAIRHLSESSSLDKDVRFVFCGMDRKGLVPDRWMSQSIQQILKGVNNWKIIKPKSRQDLAQWLATEVDICVVPSRIDNYPYVVMEASRAGCYVIASDAGGIPEIFKDYKITGALFPPGDSHALEQEIRKAIQYLQTNPEIRSQVAEEFEKSRQRKAGRTIATYNEIIELGQTHIASSALEEAAPRVSIIITFYNAHQYARDAIKSAFDSDYPDFEVILINKGSDNPKSLEFLKNIESEFPKLKIIHKSRGGLGDARNAGIEVARGEFIVPLDADSVILPNMLPSCSHILKKRQNLAYVTTYFECIREEDGASLPWQTSPISKPLGAADPLILLENTVGNAPAMIRKSALESVGGYSNTVYRLEDWDLWLKFHENGKEGDVLPEVHYIHRLRSDDIPNSLNVLNEVRLKQSLLRKHECLVKEHSMAITTLLFNQYHEWRGLDEDWIVLKYMLRHFMNDPVRALKYVAMKSKYGIKEWVRNFSSFKTLM